MDNYYEGARILNVNPDTRGGYGKGKKGIVTEVDEDYVYVRYDDGSTGKSDNPERYYRIINGDAPASQSTTNVNTIISFFKNLALSTDDKLLREQGLMTECGDFTAQAKEIVLAKQTADAKAFLVEIATAYKAEKKANKDN